MGTVTQTIAAFPKEIALRDCNRVLVRPLEAGDEQALQRRDDELVAYLEQKAEPLRKLGVEVNTIVQFGNPAERIVSYARRPEIDLIVMATHGRTGLRTVIFGSVAGRVLFSGARPVLLVRPGKLYDEPAVFWPTEATHGEARTR